MRAVKVFYGVPLQWSDAARSPGDKAGIFTIVAINTKSGTLVVSADPVAVNALWSTPPGVVGAEVAP